MTAAILLINLVFCLILAGTGWFLYKKHSAWPDTSAGYHHRAAMESREAWEKGNRLAGKLCMAEGGALFLAVPLLRLAGVTGGPLIAVWIGLMALAVLLAVFLPACALQNKGGRS